MYYRLNAIELKLPPLAERPDDILPLARHFLPGGKRLSEAACRALLRHPWPGNVRELQNVAERFALGLELALDNETAEAPPSSSLEGSGKLSEQVEHFEKSLIMAELERSHSSMRSLAEALGVPRKTLHDKLRKYGLHFESGSHAHPDELE